MIITIDTNNSAFENNLYKELSRILTNLTKDWRFGIETTRLYDKNGNYIGNVEY